MSLRFPTLALIALLVGHEVVYLVSNGTHGGARDLHDARHAAYWTWAVVGIASLAAGGLLLVAARWHALRRRLAELRANRHARLALDRACLVGALRLWASLVATTVAAFVLQENVEHVVTHGQLPGPAVLFDREYAAALPAFSFVTLLVAACATFVERRLDALARAVALTERRWAELGREARARLPRPAKSVRITARAPGTPGLGRAPPIPSTV